MMMSKKSRVYVPQLDIQLLYQLPLGSDQAYDKFKTRRVCMTVRFAFYDQLVL